MALPEDALTDWLISYLGADATLAAMLNGGVGEAIAERQRSPFVLVNRLDGEDLMVIGLHRIWVDTQYHVRGALQWAGSGAIDRTEINAIGARIDALLHDSEATSGGYRIHGFREEPEPNPVVVEGGRTWLQSGGLYRLRVGTA